MSSISGLSDGTLTEDPESASNIYFTDGEFSFVLNALNKSNNNQSNNNNKNNKIIL